MYMYMYMSPPVFLNLSCSYYPNPETRAALIGVDLLTKGDTGLYALEKDSTTLPRFLNRLLGVPVRLQNQLFAYFTDSLANIIKKAKRTGSWDGGIRGEGTGSITGLVISGLI